MEEQLKRQHKLGEVFQKQGGEEKGCPEDKRRETPGFSDGGWEVGDAGDKQRSEEREGQPRVPV